MMNEGDDGGVYSLVVQLWRSSVRFLSIGVQFSIQNFHHSHTMKSFVFKLRSIQQASMYV